jgi:pyruvate, water dikinase
MPASSSGEQTIGTGLPQLDGLLQGLRPGDNLVWQVQHLQDYTFFALPFLRQALIDGRQAVYLRFGDHAPLISPEPGLEIIELDARPGFDHFTGRLHSIIEERGSRANYVFDNLSSLINYWATNELLANFFQITCPYIFQLGSLAYFALSYGRHPFQTIARIKTTTQIMINMYHTQNDIFIHPQKVWERYAPDMFVPHRVEGNDWPAVLVSGEAAAVSSRSFPQPLLKEAVPHSPWDSIYIKLIEYLREHKDEAALPPEISSLKGEYTRILLGNHPQFIKLAEKYLTISDLVSIRSRLIGSGRIGGKAAGMLLARRILLSSPGFDFAEVLEPHDSFYIGSDVFYTFLVENNLFEERLRLARAAIVSAEEFNRIEARFKDGIFPADAMDQFRNMLDYFGQAPIIVRSSSLMEDGLGNAFAGKYLSVFLANQGDPEGRMGEFLAAVREVYASTLNPDAVAYRHHQGLTENDEQMAVVVQRVSGQPYKQFFFPPLAGVAFSRNAYPWTSRIDPEKGLIRLVFGLGTRSVNRVSGDYTRLVAVSHAELRPEVGEKVIRYSQHSVDVLDINANQFSTVGAEELLGPEYDYPGLELLASAVEDDYAYDMAAHLDIKRVALTFDGLIRRTPFVPVMDKILTTLDTAYGQALDTEFTAFANEDGKIKINLLQCRALRLPGGGVHVELPTNLPAENVLFTSNHFMNAGKVDNISFILYVSEEDYAATDMETRRRLGRLIGKLNEHKEIIDGELILIGPGRWGSSNLSLGINVGYADISHAKVLVEVGEEKTGYIPELSFGTHFFQDLVESQILYVAIYPGQAASYLNTDFLDSQPNTLLSLLPEAQRFDRLLRLVNIPKSTNGLKAVIAADNTARRAVCYLE